MLKHFTSDHLSPKPVSPEPLSPEPLSQEQLKENILKGQCRPRTSQQSHRPAPGKRIFLFQRAGSTSAGIFLQKLARKSVIAFASLLMAFGCSVSNLANAAQNVPGGVYLWPLPDGANDVRYADRPVLIHNGHAVVGLSVKAALGPTKLSYTLGDKRQTHTFTIVDKRYTEQHITLKNKEMVNPNPEQLKRIRSESVRQRAVYESYTAPISLAGGLGTPLKGRTTSLFGHRRFFNGQARNPHSGLDIAAPTGTPITAPIKGNVVMADDLYYNGNAVFLDHGQGFISMYCHMSKISVAEGQIVARGDELGLVGATGRVTGPHLHWSVSLNGTRVDPTVMQRILASLEPSG